MAPQSSSIVHPADSIAVLVCEDWLDEFCEEVGSLSAALQALARIGEAGSSHGLIAESLGRCAVLQDLLNEIPVWSGNSATRSGWTQPVRERSDAAWTPAGPVVHGDDAAWDVDELGDSFPEIAVAEDHRLPAIDCHGLEMQCWNDVGSMRKLLGDFRERVVDDLRQLELMSLGHDWLRLSRMAGALKNSAARVSAYRIVVDAAALQSAARIGCRKDVDLALDALRCDLKECSQEVEEWLGSF